jgi:hypothetical protein
MRILLRLGIALIVLGSIGLSALYHNIVTTPYENLMRQWIAHIDEATAQLAGVDDEASAQDAAAKLEASNDDVMELMKHTREENGEITSEEDGRLWDKYGYQFEEAGRKFRNRRDALRGRRPELWKILEEAAGQTPGVKSPAEQMDDDLRKAPGIRLPF